MKNYSKSLIVSSLGVVLAIVTNLFFPQFAAVAGSQAVISGYAVNNNDLYRFVLVVWLLWIAGTWLRAGSEKERQRAFAEKTRLRLALGIAVSLWDVLGTKLQVLPQPFFPGPAGIASAFLEDPDYILQNTMYSLRLFTAGFLSGVILGIITGVLVGWFPKVAYWVEPVLNVCGVIPPVAWMPFALILFPTSFTAAVFLLIICVWFPVTSMTALGVSGTPKALYEAASTLGAGTVYQIFTIAIPHAMPQIFVGVTTAEAFAFTNLVMAEMMGQPGGLGYYINASKVWSAYYKVFAAIIVMTVLFGLIKLLVDRLQRHVLRWQKGIVK
ncbi:MAG: ABC transporter permease subunit [Clostridia bacterium]|nr:ABC transporter permease subunit [Clostridia bacterium]